MTQKKSILALDPSLRCSGWVVFSEGMPIRHGIIQTQARGRKSSLRKGSADIQDIISIQRELLHICTDYNIALVVAEESAGSSKSTRGTKSLAYAMSIVCSLDGFLGIPIVWVRYDDVKKYTVGKKSATKEEVRNVAQSHWAKYVWPINGRGKDEVSKPYVEAVGDAAGVYYAARQLDPTVRILEKRG